MSLRYGLTRALSSIPKSTVRARSFITGPILQHGDCNPYSGSSMSRTPTRIPGPVELSIQQKVNDNLSPTLLHIQNDSSKHAHHRAMKEIGGGGGETHFTLTVVSPQFNDLTRIKRHRMINTLLKEEFDDKGLHALSLQLKTPAEWEQDIIAAEAKMVKQ